MAAYVRQSGLESGVCRGDSVADGRQQPRAVPNSPRTLLQRQLQVYGKRELLLIVGFLLPARLYQVSSPPPAPGERSFSIGQIVEDFRRHLRGNRASAEFDGGLDASGRRRRDGSPAGLKSSEITVVGEDRADIAAEMRVHSTGYDDAEAQQLAKDTVLKVDRPARASAEHRLSRKRAPVGAPHPQGPGAAAGDHRFEQRQARRQRRSSVKMDQRGDSQFKKIEGRSGNHRGGSWP